VLAIRTTAMRAKSGRIDFEIMVWLLDKQLQAD